VYSRDSSVIADQQRNITLGSLYIAGVSAFELGAVVTSPSGVTEAAEIVEVEEGFYAVNFIPHELGVHTVSVKYRDIHIPGMKSKMFDNDSKPKIQFHALLLS
jgi:filamin